MDVLSIARWYVSNGISVIPVKADGSKSPALTGWRKYSNELPDDATLVKWFGTPGELVGVGVPAGPASGNLVVLDFEFQGESAYFEWVQRLPEDLRKVADSLPTVSTPSGGRHLWVRLTEPQPGGKLARYANGKTKIEVRGEGHQVLAPGCPVECHRSGKLYEWVNDDPKFVELDADEWAALCEHAAMCNEHTPPEQPRDRDSRGTPAGTDSPGNDFNARGTWAETGLFDQGWSWSRKCGEDKGFLTRPGKESGISASVGMVSSKETGYPFLYVWSTSTDFAPETPYSRFAVYAMLKHKGDFSEAAKDLMRLGYGERPGMSGNKQKDAIDFSEFSIRGKDGKVINPFKAEVNTTANTAPQNDGKPNIQHELKPFKWMSELGAVTETAKWVWTGYLARGGITLFSALWKSGKSTILSHLLKSLDGSQNDFLGQAVVPARVLYVTEEHEGIWADRRDKLLIGDHVGIACRPFKMRPTMQEWRDYLKLLADTVRKHHFDVVVFDTLSKMWPVREENDAGQVEEALMPLWNMAQEDVSILLVHHTRKSGGEQFVGSRGSGGLPAFCEILMEFTRTTDDPKETQRVIKAMGRYEETPVKLLAELQNGHYVCHGDPDDAEVRAEHKNADWKKSLYDMIAEQGDSWSTFEEIREKVQSKDGEAGRKADMLAVVNGWVEKGELERSGLGKGKSPYRYRVVTMSPNTVPFTGGA